MKSTLPRDTTIEAARVQVAAMARLGHEERARLASDLCQSQREMMIAGVRRRHPDYSDDQVRLAVIRLTLGNELFKRVYWGVEVEP